MQIRVDRVREALAFSAGRPYESARRVARILRADLLGIEAENALLKSLEEPGERFRWILTTARPELLLSTIRSRCTPAALPDALARRAAARLGGARVLPRTTRAISSSSPRTTRRTRPAGSSRRGCCARRSWPRSKRGSSPAACRPSCSPRSTSRRSIAPRRRVLSELLADAALTAGAPPAEAIRHQAVGGRLAALARAVPHAALREAALLAADPPPDNRRGNRRMHYERVLLELYGAARREGRLEGETSKEPWGASGPTGYGRIGKSADLGAIWTDGRCGKLGLQTPSVLCAPPIDSFECRSVYG